MENATRVGYVGLGNHQFMTMQNNCKYEIKFQDVSAKPRKERKSVTMSENNTVSLNTMVIKIYLNVGICILSLVCFHSASFCTVNMSICIRNNNFMIINMIISDNGI